MQLIVTSPPYWTLKTYLDTVAQLSRVEDYNQFISEMEKVWRGCFNVLVAGGKMVAVVGDVSMRRQRHGRQVTFPLHAAIVENGRLQWVPLDRSGLLSPGELVDQISAWASATATS